jgi:CelD/BcsL family acetyltransferase involved in cellulose biosynthesis
MKTLPRAGVVRMLATALGDVDCAVLERMPRIHGGVVQPLGVLPRTAMSNKGYPFDLSGGFEAVLGQRNGSPRRKRTRRKERRMREAGELRYLMAPNIEQEREALEFFFEQKALRLSEQGKPNSFDQPGVKDFYRDLLERSLGMPEPVLEIATLTVGGKIRAVTGSGIHRGHVNSYFTAFALDDLAQHSPGNILTHRHIEDCCKRGMSMYDLGIGYEDYKTHWCEDALALDDGYAAFTPLGEVAMALIRMREAAKNRMRRNRSLWRNLKAAQAHFSRHPS